MNVRVSVLFASTAFVFSCLAATPSLADGMPYSDVKPAQSMSPLDKALNEIRSGKKEEEKKEAVKPAEKEKKEKEEKTESAAAVPPVPESRVVEVQPNTSFFGLSVGMYAPFTHDEKAASFSFEWQPGVKIAGVLQPIFGAFITSQGTTMGYGGVGVPFKISDRLIMMPSVAVGAYEEGDGYDLGHTFAIRAGAELAYEFEDKSRIGLNLHILTNGTSLSHDDRTEMLGLVYTMPVYALSSPDKADMSGQKTKNSQ